MTVNSTMTKHIATCSVPNAATLASDVAALQGRHNYLGIRMAYGAPPEAGSTLAPSYDGFDEHQGEILSGTSTIGIDRDPLPCEAEQALRDLNHHVGYGGHCMLVAGASSDYGDDPGESVIRNAIVLKVYA